MFLMKLMSFYVKSAIGARAPSYLVKRTALTRVFMFPGRPCSVAAYQRRSAKE